MILVLAGTIEGRNTAALLQQNGYNVTASAVTEYGANLLKNQGVTQILTGCMDETSLKDVLSKGFGLLVDATHPFAAVGSQNAIAATRELGIPYLRLERPAVELPVNPLVYTVEGLEQSIRKALSLGTVLFSTLGSKNLPAVITATSKEKVRLVVRVLPDKQVLNTCFELGLTPADIIALQGPCSVELNKALYRQYKAEVILTKDSGSTGGLAEKVSAALEAGIPIVVWQRPKLNYPLLVNTPEQVLEYCRQFTKLQGGILC